MQSKTKQNGVTYAFLGSSGCGKSTLLREVFIDQLYNGPLADKEYIIMLMTKSPWADPLQGMPKKILVDGNGIDGDAINLLYQMNVSYNKRYNFVVLVDDVIHVRHNQMLENMFLTMRNTNITSLVSIQYAKLLPPSIRTSVYFSFCMKQNNRDAIEVIVRGWVGAYLPGKRIQEKMDYYQEWTEHHQFFLLDNSNYDCQELFIQSFSEESSDVLLNTGLQSPTDEPDHQEEQR
jgi:hypothetical protein